MTQCPFSTKPLSIDIETYGLFKTLPEQTLFHPKKSMYFDGVERKDVSLICSVTEIDNLDSDPTTWNVQALAAATPGDTRVFNLWNKVHVCWLDRWLSQTQACIGHHIHYDILYLRACFKRLRTTLTREKLFIHDTSITNYLHSELRPERSLKNLGPILGTHIYEMETVAARAKGEFGNKDDPAAAQYCAEDTHNPVLVMAALAQRITKDFPDTDKLSPSCLSFYSDVLWTCIQMAEAGIPMSIPALEDLNDELEYTTDDVSRVLEAQGIIMQGTGSVLSQTAFLKDAITHIEEVCEEFYPAKLERTPVEKRISFNATNRHYLKQLLPQDDPLCNTFGLIDEIVRDRKLLNSFLRPLLGPNNRGKFDSTLIPIREGSTIGIAYPTWYPVPGPIKDSSGGEGGTKQGRITCKYPAAQTFPPKIKGMIRSRWKYGHLVVFDLSQIELRVAALLSGEPTMLREYAKSNPDLHIVMAVDIFGPEVMNHPGFGSGDGLVDARQWAKHINFLILYRGGAEKLQHTLLDKCGVELSLPRCEELVNLARSSRKTLWTWQESLVEFVRRHGYLHIPITGQTRYFMGGDKYEVNEIVNCPIQTTAGNVMLFIKAALARLLPSLGDPSPYALLFHNIYDSGYIDCRTLFDAHRVARLVKKAVAEVENTGYWYTLQQLYGRKVSLSYELDIYPPKL